MKFNGVIRISDMLTEIDDAIKIIRRSLLGREIPPEDLEIGSVESLPGALNLFCKFRRAMLRWILRYQGCSEEEIRSVIAVLKAVLGRLDRAIQLIRRAQYFIQASLRRTRAQKGKWFGGTCLLSRCDLLV